MFRFALANAVAVSLAALAQAAPSVSPDPKSLDVPSEQLERAKLLVRKLGSESYTDREAATRELRDMGRLALPVLGDAANDLDPEIRFRSELLLPAAVADDFEARMATFLADSEGKFEHELPGWDKFRKQAGDDSVSRKLFSELLRDPARQALLLGLVAGNQTAVDALTTWRQTLYLRMYQQGGQRQQASLSDAAALLFAETLVGDGNDGGRRFGGIIYAYTLLSQPNIRSALESDKAGPCVKKLVGAWADSRTQAASMYQALNLLTNLKLKEAATLAGKMLVDKNVIPTYKAMAAVSLAKLGEKEHLPLLRPMLENDMVLRAKVGANGEIQLRDVAVSMGAFLEGKTPGDYGMKSQVPNLAGDARLNWYYYSFASDEDRKAGLAKWAEAHPATDAKLKVPGDPK